MKTFKLTIATILAIMILNAGCKKDKNEKNKPNCRIITISASPSGTMYNYTYNSDGTVSTMSIGNDVTTYAYSGNTVIGTSKISGVFNTKKIITLNSNGLASNVKTEYTITGTTWDNTAYDYNGTELIKSTFTSSTVGTPLIITLTWNNGNLISFGSGGSVTNVEYFMDKPAQLGDYFSIDELQQGVRKFKIKNAVKSMSSGPNVISFDYSFDNDGKISSMKISGASNSTDTYQHQCN